jgi:cyclase
MLKKRIIPVLLLQEGRMVKGKNFKDYVDTGNPISQVKIYTAQYTDELMFIDIQASLNSRKTLLNIISSSAKESHMPFSVGGGIKSLTDIREILAAGADKVLINTSAFENRDFIKQAVKKFGSQAIILGIDYKYDDTINQNRVWTHSATKQTIAEPFELSQIYEDLNVGEIMLNSIDRDGMMKGYDIDLAKKVSKTIKIPVILCGGGGNFDHLVDVFNKTEVAATACGSLFHFGDNSPMRARSHLKNQGILMRSIR